MTQQIPKIPQIGELRIIVCDSFGWSRKMPTGFESIGVTNHIPSSSSQHVGYFRTGCGRWWFKTKWFRDVKCAISTAPRNAWTLGMYGANIPEERNRFYNFAKPYKHDWSSQVFTCQTNPQNALWPDFRQSTRNGQWCRPKVNLGWIWCDGLSNHNGGFASDPCLKMAPSNVGPPRYQLQLYVYNH